MEKEYEYMVCTKCMTYNHAAFINIAMDGFVMQQTTFPVVYVIVDDHSPDGEAEIITKYLMEHFNYDDPASVCQEETEDYLMTFAQHLENKNCYFAVLLLKYRHWGIKSKDQYLSRWVDNAKYHALCEGDDYWIAENKLQMQVDFLENNLDHVLTCHRYKVYDFENDTWSSDKNDNIFYNNPTGISFDFEHNKPWLTKTLSLVYRANVYEKYKSYIGGLDVEIVYLLLKHGKGFCFNQIWGVYRLNEKGIYGKQSILTNRWRAYMAIKRLYQFDPNPMLRRMYYDNYSSVLFFSKGKILLQEKFELRKFFAAFYFAIIKTVRFLMKKYKNDYRL